MGVDRFEDLRVWQAATAFANDIRHLLKQMTCAKDFGLADQLNRASLSTVANIAEGFMRRGCKDFARFIRIASASNGEARALLHVANGRGYLDPAAYARLVEATEDIGRMLFALHRSLKQTAAPRGTTR